MQKSQFSLNKLQEVANPQKRLHDKTKMIEILEQKNQKLFKEVQKITKIMEQTRQNADERSKQGTSKASIMQTSNDPELLNRQLKNCYKKIQLYEYEVEKLKEKNSTINSSQKIMGYEIQLKQKKNILDKLKVQLGGIMREIENNSKKLGGGSHQQEMEKQFKIKTDQLKFLRQMIKEYESKDAIKQKNLKAQYNHIKKIQKQYIQNAGSLQELQLVKQKAINQFQAGRLRQNTKQTDENYYDRFNKLKMIHYNNTSVIVYQNQEAEVIEDRTRTNYEALINELSVLEKLNKKYEKQIEESEGNMLEIDGKSQLTKKRLEKLEKQIQELNSSIKLQKTCIVPDNMKPSHRRSSIKSVNAKDDFLNNSEVEAIPNRRKRNIINMTTISANQDQRLYYS